jgi:hypothetical protein
VSTMISFQWFPQIVWSIRVFWFRGLLGSKSSLAEIAIEPTGREFVADNRLDRGPAGINLPPRVMRCPVDRPGANFRLENGRYWLCLVLQTALHPPELRSVQSGHLDHGDPHVAFVVDQLAAQRVRESGDSVLSGTICRLQGYASIDQSGTDLNNRAAIPGQHASQRRESAINNTEVCNLRDALVFFRHHFPHRRKYRETPAWKGRRSRRQAAEPVVADSGIGGTS